MLHCEIEVKSQLVYMCNLKSQPFREKKLAVKVHKINCMCITTGLNKMTLLHFTIQYVVAQFYPWLYHTVPNC